MSGAISAKELTPSLHLRRTRLLYQANHLRQFPRRKTDILRYRHGLQPNFHGCPCLVHVDVGRLVGFMAVKIEPIAADSKNSWHLSAPASYSAASCCSGA